jgi:glycosyltransferase involved in cell wall biosynthesis
MKVTIIGPAYPLRGGIAHHVYYLKKELSERGHSVQVISFRKLYPGLLFPGRTEFDTSAARLDADSLSLLVPLNPITWYRAARAVKSFAPDIVIFQWWHPFFAPLVGTLARVFRRNGLRCILECHNVFSHDGIPFTPLLLKFATKPIDSFITHSSSDRRDLLPFASGKTINVAALPVPSEFSGEGNQTRSGRTILFFGMVRKYKGLDVLLRAMPKVLARMECKLLIAGEFYDPIDKYLELIREYGLEQYVVLDNRYIPNEEVAGIFNRVDVLVLPYLNATQSAVARIALANALPLIVSRSGGLSEIVVENVNGLLFPVGDSDALADQIISYFKNEMGPVLARNLRSAAEKSPNGLTELIEEIALGHESAPFSGEPHPMAESRE